MNRNSTCTTSGFSFTTHGAPEIILQQPRSTKSDMWSLGVILYELITSKHPFGEYLSFSMLKAIQNGEYEPLPENIP